MKQIPYICLKRSNHKIQQKQKLTGSSPSFVNREHIQVPRPCPLSPPAPSLLCEHLSKLSLTCPCFPLYTGNAEGNKLQGNKIRLYMFICIFGLRKQITSHIKLRQLKGKYPIYSWLLEQKIALKIQSVNSHMSRGQKTKVSPPAQHLLLLAEN